MEHPVGGFDTHTHTYIHTYIHKGSYPAFITLPGPDFIMMLTSLGENHPCRKGVLRPPGSATVPVSPFFNAL